MITRSLEKAKEAYAQHSIEASKKAHDVKKISAEEKHNTTQGQYLKSIVYGGLDGTITTFAVVAGVAGAALSPAVVLILGFANLVADGISMAIGDYLSSKAEKEYNRAERRREAWEFENYPEGEKLEMVQIYETMGVDKKDSTTIVDIMSKHKKAFVNIMMVEELGIVEDTTSPVKNALFTFFSFAFFGFIPLVAYVFASMIPWLAANTFLVACGMTGMTLFLMGSLKTKITERSWFKSGLEMLLVGGLAAGAAYGIGAALGGLA